MSRIVIIEDDPLMRSLLAEWLTAEGYGVESIAGDNAQPSPSVDLVIVDVYMPRWLGVERLRSARRAYPGVPIIASSGQFRAGLDCAGPAAQALGVERGMAKPFSRETLLHAIRSVIGVPAIDSG